MLRPASRILSKQQFHRPLISQLSPLGRRQASFASSQKRGTWKGTAARWGLAVGAVWWYMTSDVFADDGGYVRSRLPELRSENEHLPTVDELAETRRQKRLKQQQQQQRSESQIDHPQAVAVETPSSAEVDSPPPAAQPIALPAAGDLEDEAEEQGAFNEETGEINWDCPCLGGMAHGPCGPEFREAFSCFVYSQDEPKGINCIDKFKSMQDCFRAHPDVYGAELAEEAEEDEEIAKELAAQREGGQKPPSAEADSKAAPEEKTPNHTLSFKSQATLEPESESESDPDTASDNVSTSKPTQEGAPKGRKDKRTERVKGRATEQAKTDHGQGDKPIQAESERNKPPSSLNNESASQLPESPFDATESNEKKDD